MVDVLLVKQHITKRSEWQHGTKKTNVRNNKIFLLENHALNFLVFHPVNFLHLFGKRLFIEELRRACRQGCQQIGIQMGNNCLIFFFYQGLHNKIIDILLKCFWISELDHRRYRIIQDLSVPPSLRQPRSFLGIGSLAFSKFWHSVRNPYEIVRITQANELVSWIFCKKNFLP